MKAELPDNETQRLEALLEYKILDTPEEQAFDDLTRLAAYICGTPISLISLIDAQRQWLKSKVGLDVSETPRELAFCTHAILQPNVFIVTDATTDERFAMNPLVTSDPNIRFYAGVPLITAEKQALGTLCVIDHVPRNLEPQQLEALRILGRQVIQQLELRRNLANLTLASTERKQGQKKSKHFFQGLARGFGVASAILIIIGLVSYQSTTRLIETNSRVTQTQQRLNKLERLLSQVKDAETGQRGYLLTGEERYLEPYYTALATLAHDIEELRELTANYPNQQKQLHTLESLIKNRLAELKGAIDLREGQGFEAALQLMRTNLGKKSMDDIRKIFREMESEGNALLKQQVAAAQVSARYTIVTLAIAIFLTFIILCWVYYLIYCEITERQWVEEALKKERNFIGAVLDTSSALVVVLDRAGKIVRFNRACEQTTGYSFEEVRSRYFWNLFLIPEEVEPVKAIFAKLQAGQFPNEAENYWVTKDGRRRIIAWSNTALLDNQGKVEYVISTGIDITKRKQAEEELHSQNLILQSDLHQAAEYVRSLLPPPLTGTVTTQALFIPSLQLGGDAFDYYWLDADHLAIYLLDVAGHGVRSALLSVSVLNVLRSQSLPNTNFYQPSAVLTALNRVFQMNENGDDYFTIWYGVYHRITRQLVYACAGHPPALLLSKETFRQFEQAIPDTYVSSITTPVKQLEAQGIPIGMLPETDFDDDWCEIPVDSTLYLLSDGVYEIHRPDGKIWGLNSFIDLLTDYQKRDFTKLEELLHQIQLQTATKAFDDDFSLLQINFK